MSINNGSLFDVESVNQTLLSLKLNNKQTVGKFIFLLPSVNLSIYKPDEDIEMKVCELYSLHQSKPTDNVYDKCESSVDNNVHECI